MSLYITDSVLKADAAVSKGICCIDLLGDWCWSRLDKAGERKPLPGWSQIKRDARQVFVVFDSDFIADLDIYSKLLGLSDYLEGEGIGSASFICRPAQTVSVWGSTISLPLATNLQNLKGSLEDFGRPSAARIA